MMRCDSRACVRAARPASSLARAAASCASAPRTSTSMRRSTRSRSAVARTCACASVTRAVSANPRKMFTRTSAPITQLDCWAPSVSPLNSQPPCTATVGSAAQAPSPVLGELEMDVACRSCGCLVSASRTRASPSAVAGRGRTDRRNRGGQRQADGFGELDASDREVPGRRDLPLAHVRQVHVDREDIRFGDEADLASGTRTLAIALRRRHGRVRGSHRRLELQNAHERLRCPEAQVLPRSIPAAVAMSRSNVAACTPSRVKPAL